jgi:hypothetical protein
MTKRRSRRPQPTQMGSVIVVLSILFLYAVYVALTGSSPLAEPTPPPPTPLPGLPGPETRATPVVVTFKGCPPEGDRGDPALNYLKNRIDAAPLTPVLYETALNLTWPKAIERRDRANWPAVDAAAIAAVEGLPVSVEAYLWDARKSGTESANCHSVEDFDWHVWLIARPGDDRTRSLIAEPTPRTLALHPGWTLAKARALAAADTRVRVTGWLFFDPEHPEQLGKTRGTIWEIHPVTGFEVQVGSGWQPLDEFEP